MKKINPKNRFLPLILICLVGCASTAVEYIWEDHKEEVCQRNWFFGKKECIRVDRMGWVPKNKIALKGVGVKVDFEKRTAEGGTFIPPIPIKL